MRGTTDFTRDFQELITSYPWGTIWTRPGLDHRTRRLLVLTTTAALGRWEEFRLHVRTGLAHELEPCDLEEVLLQLAVYAGVPAANAAFHVAAEILGEKRVTVRRLEVGRYRNRPRPGRRVVLGIRLPFRPLKDEGMERPLCARRSLRLPS